MAINTETYADTSNRLKPQMLKEWDMVGDTFTIELVDEKTYEATEANGMKAETKLRVHFCEINGAPLEMNRTQLKAMQELHGWGEDIDDELGDPTWIGAQVRLEIGKTRNPKGETVDTIQIFGVKPPKPATVASAPRPASAMRPAPKQAPAVADDSPFADE